MREDELHRLLTVAAEDVLPAHPAVTGWDRAGRVRRNRRATAATALAVVLLTGGTALALHPTGAPALPGATPASSAPALQPSTPASSAPAVQQPPAELTYPGDTLGRLGDPVTAKLSDRLVRRALALYQPVDRETGVADRIRVLGDDGLTRELDVVTPAPTRDAEGNEAVPLKTGSLSPDGRWAAFAQTDEVIVVDLTTAEVRRHPLKGFLEHVLWAGDRLVVGDNDTAYEVNRATGRTRTLPGSPWDLVTPDPGAGVEQLVAVGETPDGLMVSRYTANGKEPDRQRVTADKLPPGYGVREFYGRGWQDGDRLARAGWITADRAEGIEGVAVLDARTGAVTQLLNLGRDRWKGCCEVLGWDRNGAVLLRHDPGGLLRWDPLTGEVVGVVRHLYGEVSLATR